MSFLYLSANIRLCSRVVTKQAGLACELVADLSSLSAYKSPPCRSPARLSSGSVVGVKLINIRRGLERCGARYMVDGIGRETLALGFAGLDGYKLAGGDFEWRTH